MPLRDCINQFGDIPISKIKSAEIQQFINSFSKLGKARQTVNLRLVVMEFL
ncbi:MAG TPA: hypothetical protein GXZ23_03335 [Clostridiales bacterium]|nr:hypothetical protein [Clostridiales bacterium]